ncbi:MAG: M20/M25/M40 family metallo-hydrolase [Phycisphaerales bacterium]|nr:MAG: M20/M25/M40 family metallo-hydrolase [Phycisphaerales bacterium]
MERGRGVGRHARLGGAGGGVGSDAARPGRFSAVGCAFPVAGYGGGSTRNRGVWMRMMLAAGLVALAGAAASGRDADLDLAIVEAVDAERLRGYHDALSSRPHRAGTPGDREVIEWLARTFESFGLEVEVHEIEIYAPHPVSGSVEVIGVGGDGQERERLSLAVQEKAVEGDPFSAHEELSIGWNAYSASGAATGEVVYANYGTKEDFEALSAAGIDVEGRIVLARYGRNYRGYKAYYAEQAGAAGLVIYTDPANDGYARGRMWPEGGFANETSIQRGSVLTLPYFGDPLTPFEPARPLDHPDTPERLDPSEVGLPTIPVQPIGWGAAEEILKRMRGRAVQEVDGLGGSWQGGLPLTYRVEGGDGLRVRVAVEQDLGFIRTANVVGTLRGETHPDQYVILGSHHDAWGFGAGDAQAGTICVVEAARVLAELAAQGRRPARSIQFAAWGAEEHGIIGSVEWLEEHRERLHAGAVAYLNLDMAAMGPQFRASASPTLRPVIAEAAKAVPQAGDSAKTVFDDWFARGADDRFPEHPRLGDLGGGSDHVGFICRFAIASGALGGGGSRGVSYHTAYDNLAWYRAIVGDDYEPAVMITRVVGVVASRLAGEAVLPLAPERFGEETLRHLPTIRRVAAARGIDVDGALAPLSEAAEAFGERAHAVMSRVREGAALGELSPEALDRVNARILASDRAWLHEAGMPERPWFRSLFAATDETSGYAAWMLPMLRKVSESGEPKAFGEAVGLYLEVFDRLGEIIDAIERELPSDGERGR